MASTDRLTSSSTIDRESRFLALLQPIRDLAQNWCIDVARDLEDYLEELESIQISLDGGRSTLNFAEAAMLIQGSAAVYSRKVEYLYALIYQTLDMITANKKKALANGKVKPRDVQDADADELLRHEAEEEFLLLEAVKEGKAVDLKEKKEEVELQTALTYGYSGRAHAAAAAAATSLQYMLNLPTLRFESSSSQSQMNSSSNNISNTSMHVGDVSGLPGLNLNITMAKSVLMSPAASKMKSTLLARTPLARMTLAGSIGGAAAIGGLGGVGGFGQPGAGIGGFFKVANSSVDFVTGALMLPGSTSGNDRVTSILTLEPAFLSDTIQVNRDDRVSLGANRGVGGVVETITTSAGTMHDENQPILQNDAIDNHDYDNDGGGGGFDDNGWFHETAPVNGSGSSATTGVDIDPTPPTQSDRILLPRAAKSSSSSYAADSIRPSAADSKKKKKLDPWASLDPSIDLGPVSHRPFQASRTWVHIPDPTLVAARGPEAAAAAIAAQRAKTLNMGGKADPSSLRLAKILTTQAKLLASRANASRASGPLVIPKILFSGKDMAVPHSSSLSGGGTSSSSSSSSTLTALTSSVGSGTTDIFDIGPSGVVSESHYSSLFFVSIDKALATFSTDAAVAASAGARAGCGFEFSHLIARQKAASLRARRAQRSAIAVAFPEQAAAGAAYDDVAFFGGGDDYDYDGGDGGGGNDINAPAEIRPAYNDALNTGEVELDPFAPSSGAIVNDDTLPKLPSMISTAASAAATATMGINLDDPMAYLNDPVQGDAVYHAEKVSQKTRSETVMTSAIQNAQGLMTSLDGEDDAFHATVRAQIAAFTANADAFLASSRMQRRIEGWQKRMEPLLEEEEARPEFNMRTYGDQIVQALSTSSCTEKEEDKNDDDNSTLQKTSSSSQLPQMIFSHLVKKLQPEPYEICRLFLATLQLANNGNVQIMQQGISIDDNDDDSMMKKGTSSKFGAGAGLSTPPIHGQQDSARLGFSIKLLSSVPSFDAIHAFKPPSDKDTEASIDPVINLNSREDDEEGEDDDNDDDFEASVRGNKAKRARETMIAALSPTKSKANKRQEQLGKKRTTTASSTGITAAAVKPPLPPMALEKRGRPLGPTSAASRPIRASKRSKSRDSETVFDENDNIEEEEEEEDKAVLEKFKTSSRASSRSKGKGTKAIIFGEEDIDEDEASLRSPVGKKAALLR
jgi:hypothetical protein